MSRQPSSRNQRSKGIKVKHVLQIFLLLAVCFWLIYQVKHSHDKKKEFDESDAKASISRGGSDGFIRLGRKDIHPQEEDTIIKNEKHDEEAEEEETTGDVDENNHEEEELEDKKVEDNENEKVGHNGNEKVGGGDDEIEDHGKEKLDSEVDREEDFVDGEERDDDDENENEEKDTEDEGQMAKESSIERGDHDGGDTGTHEAREEHYKGDDASSAVTNNAQVEATVNASQNDENVNGHPENILEETDTGEKRKELEERGEVDMDEKQSNVTIGEVKENVMDGSDNGSSLNTTVTEVSDDHLKTSNSSMEISTVTHDQEILFEGTSLERSNLQNIDVKQAGNSTLVMDDNHIGSNSTDPDETKDAKSNTLKSSEMSNDTHSSTETNDAIDAEKSDADDGANETLESENTENSEEIQQDSIDLSDSFHSLEETDTRLDPDTLPEIQTKGTNSEDAESYLLLAASVPLN